MWIETETIEKLKKESDVLNISLAELCRQRLKENSQLTRMEFLISELNKKLILTKFKQEVKMVKNQPKDKKPSIEEIGELEESEDKED